MGKNECRKMNRKQKRAEAAKMAFFTMQAQPIGVRFRLARKILLRSDLRVLARERKVRLKELMGD